MAQICPFGAATPRRMWSMITIDPRGLVVQTMDDTCQAQSLFGLEHDPICGSHIATDWNDRLWAAVDHIPCFEYEPVLLSGLDSDLLLMVSRSREHSGNLTVILMPPYERAELVIDPNWLGILSTMGAVRSLGDSDLSVDQAA